MGIFRVFRGKGLRNFSALQTAWRSGKDSNPRYRSETWKSRRVRKLHGIRSFKNSLCDCLLAAESSLTGGVSEGVRRRIQVPKPVPMMPTEVNSLCTNPRLLIALHSPYALLETGLRMCPPEKAGTVTLFTAE
jgi:hypothetical protein